MAGLPHHEREVTTLKEMLAKLDIHDVWRTNHPDRKEYTWSKPTPFTARIIDYIFCDTTSLTKITNSSIEGFSHSDHKLVKVQINMNSFRRGPGYWKFNSSLLSEADFGGQALDILLHGPESAHKNSIIKTFIHTSIPKHILCTLLKKKKKRRSTYQT